MSWDVDAGNLADALVPVVTIWREAENQGQAGMTAVGWVIQNRCIKRSQTAQQVCLAKWQFSSMSAPNDPGLLRWPSVGDPFFRQAYAIWQKIQVGNLPDPTGGCTLYYADWISPPNWVAASTFVVKIGNQLFYKEN